VDLSAGERGEEQIGEWIVQRVLLVSRWTGREEAELDIRRSK